MRLVKHFPVLYFPFSQFQRCIVFCHFREIEIFIWERLAALCSADRALFLSMLNVSDVILYAAVALIDSHGVRRQYLYGYGLWRFCALRATSFCTAPAQVYQTETLHRQRTVNFNTAKISSCLTLLLTCSVQQIANVTVIAHKVALV